MGTLLGGDTPGEVDGQVVPAEMIRHLLRTLTDTQPPDPADAGDVDQAVPTAEAAPAEDAAPTGEAVPADDAVPAEDAAAAAPDGSEDRCAAREAPFDAQFDARFGAPWDTVSGGAADDEPGDEPEDEPEEEILRAAAAAWEREWERRLLAGELDEPDRIPDEVLAAWAAAENPNLIDADDPLTAEDLLDPGWRGIRDEDLHDVAFDEVAFDEVAFGDVDLGEGHVPGPAGRPAAGDPAAPTAPSEPSDPPPRPRGSGTAPPGEPLSGGGAAGWGWWAAADGAVADASAAVHQAVLALGRARRLVRTAQAADAADEARHRHGPAGRVTAAGTAVEALAAATADQRTWLAGLLAATGGGGLADRPRLALTDAVSGTLLALADLPALRRAARCTRPGCRRRPAGCGHDLTGRPGLGPPPPTAGYRPGAALDRWVRARDRRCRFPGCRRRVPAGGELDHTVRWPDGPTSAANLAGFCTAHHRGKHQAPGWAHTLTPDGTLSVTTPTGLTTSTQPPPY
jgi:hypothetical protein